MCLTKSEPSYGDYKHWLLNLLRDLGLRCFHYEFFRDIVLKSWVEFELAGFLQAWKKSSGQSVFPQAQFVCKYNYYLYNLGLRGRGRSYY